MTPDNSERGSVVVMKVGSLGGLVWGSSGKAGRIGPGKEQMPLGVNC